VSGRRFVLLAGAFVLAVVVVALVVRPDDEAPAGDLRGDLQVSAAPPSAAPQATLADLMAVSDAAVIGRVLGTDAMGAGLIELGVDEVLAGDDALPEVIAVEQPAWLTLSSDGDIGIWFLVRADGADVFAVVNEQGRYLVDPDDSSRFVDVPLDDPLVDELEAEDPTILRHQVQEAG
jgi:hypothetical protein